MRICKREEEMKKQLIIFVIIVLLVCVGLSGCQDQGMQVIESNEEVENFVNMTEEQMKYFPHLKEAILTNKTEYISTPSGELCELIGILRYFNTDYICYQDKYYEIGFYAAD
jgi:hypothetical protein